MKKLTRNSIVIIGVLLYAVRLSRVNPDFPLFLVIFGIPMLIVLIVDKVDFKKITLFTKINLKYGVVLSANLCRSIRFNLKQYKQVIHYKMGQ